MPRVDSDLKDEEATEQLYQNHPDNREEKEEKTAADVKKTRRRHSSAGEYKRSAYQIRQYGHCSSS